MTDNSVHHRGTIHTVDSRYTKHRYLKVPSYIQEYSLNTFPIFIYILTSASINYWYLDENFLGPEKINFQVFVV